MDVANALTAGDQVVLRQDKRGALFVDDPNGDQIGELQPQMAQRLQKLIGGGNKYVTAISSINDEGVRVFIRETYQDPSQVGKLSFPGSMSETAESVRPYTKRGLVSDEQPLYTGGEDGDEYASDEDGAEPTVRELSRARATNVSGDDDNPDDE